MAIRKIHRNITLWRLTSDFYQFVRSQRFLTRRMGQPFSRSRKFVEMDITWRCNLKCPNCNRSCTQVPSRREMSVGQVASFIRESIAMGAQWERIRVLGGEPTLHRGFFAILELLRHYRAAHNPGLRIVVCTNGHGDRVNRVLDRIPAGIAVKNTFKTAGPRLFRPFNVAPVDTHRYRFADYSGGCRIISECGIGVTPLGCYPCAIAGGIDRIFGFGLGRKKLPLPDDEMRDHLKIFCRLCGHFGFAWPTRKPEISKTWENAYRNCRAGNSSER
ncbi:molybdenum cofactor biosynthesis family protein [Desulfonema ishimotonii]|uniref:Molybdenum cofactor biosynthesis family protein n=1 Tax=Desulfonema ishimotonii TaxID=45657 RepID=A0A401FRV7_9BACT|nr:radical SAM protein [Desulfonema ishimotonii]GBC59709.1 molybdenum cofactor biosynthesis family protein [Desulfonema ishimotonii]